MVTWRHANTDLHYHIKVTFKVRILISNTLYYIKKKLTYTTSLKIFVLSCFFMQHCLCMVGTVTMVYTVSMVATVTMVGIASMAATVSMVGIVSMIGTVLIVDTQQSYVMFNPLTIW